MSSGVESAEKQLGDTPKFICDRNLCHCDSETQILVLFIILLTESILDVGGVEGLLEVLLVGEDQEGDVLVVLVLHRPPQLHLGLVQLVGLGAVHHKDDAVSAPEPITGQCSGHVICIIQSEASIVTWCSFATAAGSSPDLPRPR